MSYGQAIREEFAKTYARLGNATHALKSVLGEERAAKMKPHTLRAKASELFNDYRTQALIEFEKAEMLSRRERLPRYRKPTVRTDLMSNTEGQAVISSGRSQGYDPLAQIKAMRQQLLSRVSKKMRRALRAKR
ncbi:hypothetical protein [Rodentibacter pneumotropicus]|uniref:hypothetical protein n=1 Tax=Rodentibacter pneumotropicus TaxID=758 RepID=UPI00109CCAA7|nr:hypothetical protein [Rodentibacter pneumotropicus]TGZ98649.1 hypothetical protein D3M72_10565 [Rodentibacter pneumotropicus]